jgi:hypothetical protein
MSKWPAKGAAKQYRESSATEALVKTSAPKKASKRSLDPWLTNILPEELDGRRWLPRRRGWCGRRRA